MDAKTSIFFFFTFNFYAMLNLNVRNKDKNNLTSILLSNANDFIQLLKFSNNFCLENTGASCHTFYSSEYF